MSVNPSSQLSFGPSSSIVLIGTSSYPKDDILDDIPHAVENIRTLVSIFLDPYIIGLPSTSILQLLDEEHSSDLLDKLNKKTESTEDTLLVYYTGHGLYGDDESPLYLATKSTTDKGKSYNGIPYDKIKKAIIQSPAKRKILILDCCFSGSIFESGLNGSSIDEVLDVGGTYVIAASPANKKALALPGEKYTVFTGELIQLLEEGADNLPSIISIKNIFETIQKRLKTTGKAPLPESSNWLNGEEFLFAINQVGSEKSAFRMLSALQMLEKKHDNQYEEFSDSIRSNTNRISDLSNKLGLMHDGIEENRLKLLALEKSIKSLDKIITPNRLVLTLYRYNRLIFAFGFVLVVVISIFYFALG